MAVQHLCTQDFDAVVDAAPLAMVDFWAPWCGHCQTLGPVIERLAEQYTGKALVAKVNVDEQPELAARFAVLSIPTVVFLKNGREYQRTVGAVPAGSLAEILDQACVR